jgi:hypothetical protein
VKAEASLEAKEVAMAKEALEVALEEQAGGDEEVVIDGEMASEEGGTGQEEAHIEDKK